MGELLTASLSAEEAKKIISNNGRHPVDVIPTDKYLEKCFALLKRFLKENDNYTFIMNHIFPNGRKKMDFFKDVRKLYAIRRTADFRDILRIAGPLGDYYRSPESNFNSFSYWEKNIKSISEEWKLYFETNFPKIEDDDFILT